MKAIDLFHKWCFLLIIIMVFSNAAFGDSKGWEATPSRKTQDFSVWLIPRYDEQNYLPLQKCIEDLSKKNEIAVRDIFIPHVTIYWGKSTDMNLANITATIKKIASEYGPVTLTMAGIGITRERFKSLFITFKKDLRLYEWFDQIDKTKKVKKAGYNLMPHLSLFYPKQGIEMPFDKKVAMANYVMEHYARSLKWFSEKQMSDNEFNNGYTVVFDKIMVIREDDEDMVSSWVPISEYMLTGKK